MEHDQCQHAGAGGQDGTTTASQTIQPKKGERYGCAKCAMEVEVTQNCDCGGPCVSLSCCGQAMQKR
ncbi:MAG TPA: hypothetical protein VN688_12080 [Gemmataceae bacterium]|nr:hypothetical protein [Gemmataceae bacterium]